ncbi:hypothetical protein AUQ37_09015 [Candidatus Methanomethylophilus sp. 1R26]|uniref:recombinase family protein n=1 Tax=Candidatus Methanomethylophilus sp. 1R26 TaxID=1769296 RepID=UPI00073726DE|nr:recombinase family protein [Candidatus Methanomethylophilus sp. 1R26]KUE73387.1 hypothetical protein AUQ37_09015 [Candidatus Methanomethylophilus sp. 1R26]MEE3400654.1 recombinase family protein [Methanomethylophilus sp.]
MVRVAIYARVSTEKQDEQLQIPTLTEYAQAHGWNVAKTYTDEASGRNENRPGWKALMADASEHRFDAILVTKLDRVMRSVPALDATVSNLDLWGVRLITLDLGEIDSTSPQGKLIMQVIGSIAEWEREIIAVRTREALAAKKAAGVRLGARPREDIDYRRAAELRSAGLSWRKIAAEIGVPVGTLVNCRHKPRILELVDGGRRARCFRDGG